MHVVIIAKLKKSRLLMDNVLCFVEIGNRKINDLGPGRIFFFLGATKLLIAFYLLGPNFQKKKSDFFCNQL